MTTRTPNSDHLETVLAMIPEHERSSLRLGMELVRLGRISEVLLEQAAEEFGLNSSEATTLSALLFSGPLQEMLPSEIQRRVAHTSAGVTGILRRLETKQLIERRPHPSDGRCLLVRLTPAGARLIRAFLQRRATAYAAHFAEMNAEVVAELIDSIGAVLANLERAAGFSAAFKHPENREHLSERAHLP